MLMFYFSYPYRLLVIERLVLDKVVVTERNLMTGRWRAECGNLAPRAIFAVSQSVTIVLGKTRGLRRGDHITDFLTMTKKDCSSGLEPSLG